MTTGGNPEIGATADANGIKTNYLEAGKGDPVVLIHGSGPGVTSYANWRLVLPALAENFRVVAPDMVGFGFSERPANIEYGLQTWADQVVGLMDTLELPQAHLVGNSFGGAIALRIAAQHPDRVAKLVLMGSMGVPFPITEGGWITSGMIVDYGGPVDRSSLIHPRAEPEIAFLLGRDVTAPATVTSVLAATEAVFAAVDILDSRYDDFRFTLPDVIADNASGGRIVLGPQARRPDELVDLRLLGCVLRVGGEVVATAAGAAVSGHPAAAVAWLANRLGAQGKNLRAGMLVLSGGLTAPVPLEPGSAITAEFDGLGSIEVYCR